MNTIINVKFPFVRETYSGPTAEPGVWANDLPTWKPGTRREWSEGDYDTEEWWVADGEGLMLLEVLGTYKPGKYPERTFYLRRFVDPTGKEFGKAKVRVIATGAFKSMAKGYRHTYALSNKEVA